MEGQLHRTHEHQRYEEDPHHHTGLQVVEGEGEAEHHNHHGEKKSVLTKVKHKAKKIKDKIKHAGHAHEGDDYGDYDEDEETVNAPPHVHGAPIVKESEFISGTALPKQTGLNLENPMNPVEDRQSLSARDDDVMEPDRQHARNEMYSSRGNDQVIETSPLLEDPYIPNIRKEEYSTGAGDVGILNPLPATVDSERQANAAVKIGPLGGLEEDPHFTMTPPNYQTKVSDPTGQGGAEVDVAPLVDRLGNLQVGNEAEPEEMDQFGPTSESLGAESMLPRDTVADKISAATSVIADKASSAKDMVASKLGYGAGSTQNQVVEEPTQKGALESVSEYPEKLMQGEGAKESDKGVSVQEYLVEKFSPGEEDRELSKVISHALRGEGQQPVVKESVRVEAVVSDEKEAAGVVDRVKGAIGSWLGKNPSGHPGDGLEKEIASKLEE